MTMRRLLLLCFVLVVAGCAPAASQVVAQQVLTAFDTRLEREITHPGLPIRGVLRVPLPDGLHVQSNAPREPGLIPTELTFAPPEGISVDEVVFPPSIDLALQQDTASFAWHEVGVPGHSPDNDLRPPIA